MSTPEEAAGAVTGRGDADAGGAACNEVSACTPANCTGLAAARLCATLAEKATGLEAMAAPTDAALATLEHVTMMSTVTEPEPASARMRRTDAAGVSDGVEDAEGKSDAYAGFRYSVAPDVVDSTRRTSTDAAGTPATLLTPALSAATTESIVEETAKEASSTLVSVSVRRTTGCGVGDGEADGDLEREADEEVEMLCDGVVDGDVPNESDAVGDVEGEGDAEDERLAIDVTLGEAPTESDAVGVADGDGDKDASEADADGDGDGSGWQTLLMSAVEPTGHTQTPSALS